jgi:signal transduction histidine kinase
LQLTHNADSHVEVVVNLHPDVSVRASRQLVEAICGNLLRNAFNYTREGQVEIVLGTDFLQVTNRGPGVVAPADNDLFRPFVRGEASDGVEGYGVGLDLVRRLCELYGWEIFTGYTVESGMTFTVKL